MGPPGPVFPSIAYGTSESFPSFSHRDGKALRGWTIAHTHVTKPKRNNVLLSRRQGQGCLFLAVRPNTRWFISLGNSTLGKQRMKWYFLMKSIRSAATYRPQPVCVCQERPFFFLARDFPLGFPLSALPIEMELFLNGSMSTK